MSRIEHIGPHTLYLGDCREILPTLGKVDAVVTDPPYGVALDYSTHSDVELVEWLPIAMAASSIVAFTPGIRNVWSFPKADWVYCWAKPGSTRRSDAGGFNCWEPILVYGKKRVWSDLFYLPSAPNLHTEKVDHPCPKPLNLMLALCGVLSNSDGIVCDPFAGSGTTGIACQKLGRKFIGIEIDPKYFDIACRRLEQAMAQPDLFIQQATKPVQEVLAL